jgi:hypothetical protein
MTQTDTQSEKIICLYPGCEREAVPGPPAQATGRSGPPPRYCDIEEHNASTTFQELKRLESESSEDS